MRRPAVRLAIALCGLALLGGCRGSGEPAATSVLDGRPREPDVAGVVGAVERRSIEVDGTTYALSPDLESFSTYDGELSSVFERTGQYVHLGLDGDEVRWIAAVGLPSGSPRRVYFGSRLTGVRGDRLDFTGGTVLRLAEGVEAPAEGEVEVSIDVATDRVVEARSVSDPPGG